MIKWAELLIHYQLTIGLSLVGAIRKTNLYKRSKEILVALAGIVLVYRAISSSSKAQTSQNISILDLILKSFFASHKYESLSFLFKDITGLVICWNAFKVIDSIQYDRSSYLNQFYNVLKSFPLIRNKLQKEKSKFQQDFVKSLKSKARSITSSVDGASSLKLPTTGLSSDQIISLMEVESGKEDMSWINGRVSGAVYLGDKVSICYICITEVTLI